SRTNATVSNVNTPTIAAGRKNFHCHGSATTTLSDIKPYTEARPLWIIEPKMAENTPRSDTWNQPALTLIKANALYDWKYMFNVQIVARYPSSTDPVPSTPRYAPRPKAKLNTHAPDAPRIIAFRPPQ